MELSGYIWSYVEAMFRGTSYHTIDDKGRIIIPTRFRDVIKANGGDGVMVSSIHNYYLVAYSFEEWRQIESKFLSQDEIDDNMRKVIRFFLGAASVCNCDKQDRILIPPNFRQQAALERDVVLVGGLRYFEIWSKDNYEKESLNYAESLNQQEIKQTLTRLRI
jgi:MraZ protein